jgi:hypothetical protein
MWYRSSSFSDFKSKSQGGEMNKMLCAAVFASAAVFSGSANAQSADAKMSFFITSVGSGKGADLGGLEGADRHCQALAIAAGSKKEWRAYLSNSGPNPVNARDRIGKGPWFNFKGVQVASSADDLHSDNNKLSKENSLTEKGAVTNGRGDMPNRHDILTGSQADGRAFADAADHTCKNWTSSAPDGSASVGHHDRQGGGPAPTSWNASHPSRGCSQENLQASGGDGLFYCFATN